MHNQNLNFGISFQSPILLSSKNGDYHMSISYCGFILKINYELQQTLIALYQLSCLIKPVIPGDLKQSLCSCFMDHVGQLIRMLRVWIKGDVTNIFLRIFSRIPKLMNLVIPYTEEETPGHVL